MGSRFNKKKFKDKNRRPDFAPKRNPFELLESVNKNKDKIIQYVNYQQPDKAHQWLGYLRENQKDTPELLAKSLCDISEKITDNDIIIELLKEAAELNPVDSLTLNSYARALADAGEYEKAFRLFEESLNLKRYDITLNSYARALADAGEYEKAFELFEESLTLKRDNSVTLNSYATALSGKGEYEKAFRLFEESLAIKRSDSVTLTSYATALAGKGEYEKAFELFEESLTIKRSDSVTLTSYGQALIRAELPKEAIEKFKESLILDPDDSITLSLYGIALQMIGEYQEAVEKFERVKLEKRPQGFINFIYLTIGNLYYALRNKQEGNRYFDLAIENSESSDADKLRTAHNILAVKPYDEQAVNILKEIIKTSPSYSQALKALSLNSDAKGLFEQHKGKMTSENSLQDTASLNRALYHKIQNEIAILKEILHEIITDTKTQDETLLSVQKRIHIILEEIRRRRNIEAAEVHNIPMDDYEAILLIVSKTAHDIVDFAGNEIATIKEYIWDKLSESNKDDARRSSFQDLYKYIQSTLAALNDLKSVNEGIRIKNSRFKIKQLFETWQHTSKIRHAALVLNIKTPEEEIKGDEQKIKGFINELVENSLKHNADKNNFQIKIIADVSTNPNIKSFGKRSKFPSDRKYLHIQFSDNGKGILKDKKDWVFLPLTTTAKSNEGSGLGLFTIKKTLKEMHGYIEENGFDGVNFDIYIPYGEET